MTEAAEPVSGWQGEMNLLRVTLSEGLTRFAECVKPEHLQAVAAVARVRELHKMMVSEPGGPAYCTEDSARWPCPTIRALEGEQ